MTEHFQVLETTLAGKQWRNQVRAFEEGGYVIEDATTNYIKHAFVVYVTTVSINFIDTVVM